MSTSEKVPEIHVAKRNLGEVFRPEGSPEPARCRNRGKAREVSKGAMRSDIRRCTERACSHRRPPVPARTRKEGTGRSRWCCGKWQEREAGTHLEAPRRRCYILQVIIVERFQSNLKANFS
ncbi:hypothetical protein AB1E18_002108 [Capra hircus]